MLAQEDLPLVNMHEAKTNLSRIARDIEEGRYPSCIIARHGKPVLKIVRFDEEKPRRKLGIAQGKYPVPEDIDFCNDEIAQMFEA